MADNVDLVSWSGSRDIVFCLKSSEIRGVKDITIVSKLDTEAEKSGGENYVKKKNSGSYTITLTAVLNAALGVNVEKISMAMTEAARLGKTGYFYIASKKLFRSQFMATEAKTSKISMTRSGKWIYAEVAFTLKQSSKYGGSGADDGKKKGIKGWFATVYYSTGSGAMTKVTRFSTKSYKDALAKAWAAVPRNAHWAGTTPKQATNPDQRKGTVDQPKEEKEQEKEEPKKTDDDAGQKPEEKVKSYQDLVAEAKKKSEEVGKDAESKKVPGVHPDTSP